MDHLPGTAKIDCPQENIRKGEMETEHGKRTGLACGARLCNARPPQTPFLGRRFGPGAVYEKDHASAVTSVRAEAPYRFECDDVTLRLSTWEENRGNREGDKRRACSPGGPQPLEAQEEVADVGNRWVL